MIEQQYTQGQDQRQLQENQHSASAMAEYAKWAKDRDAENSIRFAAWLDTPEGIAWMSTKRKRPTWLPRKVWTLEEFINSPEGISWIEGCFEQTAGPCWID
jgi:hypothetical protein